MTKKERKQQWKTRIEAYKTSGLSKVAFCKQHNISVRQLHYWLKKEYTSLWRARYLKSTGQDLGSLPKRSLSAMVLASTQSCLGRLPRDLLKFYMPAIH
jgi:hypothetical protein